MIFHRKNQFQMSMWFVDSAHLCEMDIWNDNLITTPSGSLCSLWSLSQRPPFFSLIEFSHYCFPCNSNFRKKKWKNASHICLHNRHCVVTSRTDTINCRLTENVMASVWTQPSSASHHTMRRPQPHANLSFHKWLFAICQIINNKFYGILCNITITEGFVVASMRWILALVPTTFALHNRIALLALVYTHMRCPPVRPTQALATNH